MASFATIKWLRDLERKESGTPAGKGIFALKHIPARKCVALYWGNVVDASGLIQVSFMRPTPFLFYIHMICGQIPCPATKKLLKDVPDARRTFSRGHCVSLKEQAKNWIVDGRIK
jgi:hypothetical protein